jgi:hypothetical protein
MAFQGQGRWLEEWPAVHLPLKTSAEKMKMIEEEGAPSAQGHGDQEPSAAKDSTRMAQRENARSNTEEGTLLNLIDTSVKTPHDHLAAAYARLFDEKLPSAISIDCVLQNDSELSKTSLQSAVGTAITKSEITFTPQISHNFRSARREKGSELLDDNESKRCLEKGKERDLEEEKNQLQIHAPPAGQTYFNVQKGEKESSAVSLHHVRQQIQYLRQLNETQQMWQSGQNQGLQLQGAAPDDSRMYAGDRPHRLLLSRDEAADVFQQIDAIGNGEISQIESTRALQKSIALARHLDLPNKIHQEDENRKLFALTHADIDKDPTKSISLEEFLSYYHKRGRASGASASGNEGEQTSGTEERERVTSGTEERERVIEELLIVASRGKNKTLDAAVREWRSQWLKLTGSPDRLRDLGKPTHTQHTDNLLASDVALDNDIDALEGVDKTQESARISYERKSVHLIKQVMLERRTVCVREAD